MSAHDADLNARRSRGEIEQTRVAPGWPDQTDADARGIGAEAGWNGDGAHVQEVHEVGIEPETGIERYGFCEHLADAIDRGCRGQNEHIDLLPHLFSIPGVALQGIQSTERLNSRDALARLHDGTNHGVDRARGALEKWLQNARTLGNPRAAVQQARR